MKIYKNKSRKNYRKLKKGKGKSKKRTVNSSVGTNKRQRVYSGEIYKYHYENKLTEDDIKRLVESYDKMNGYLLKNYYVDYRRHIENNEYNRHNSDPSVFHTFNILKYLENERNFFAKKMILNIDFPVFKHIRSQYKLPQEMLDENFNADNFQF